MCDCSVRTTEDWVNTLSFQIWIWRIILKIDNVVFWILSKYHWCYLAGYWLKQHHTRWSSEWRPWAAAPHVTITFLHCVNKIKISKYIFHSETYFGVRLSLVKKVNSWEPDREKRRLRNLKHESLNRMMLFVHDDHHHLLCIILESKVDTSSVPTCAFAGDTVYKLILLSQLGALYSVMYLGYTDSGQGDMTSAKQKVCIRHSNRKLSFKNCRNICY